MVETFAPSRPAPSWDDPATMLDVDEASARILSAFDRLPAEVQSIEQALGQILAEDIRSQVDLPPFANSAMDGYAVRSADVTTASPTTSISLRVVGQAPAGYLCEAKVTSGTAIRIMTGAPVPDGADAIVRFEQTDEVDPVTHAPGWVAIRTSPAVGENIRPAGEDVCQGALVLRTGTAVRPAEIGLLAAIGRAWIMVHRRPRVAVLVTGDEIVDDGQPLRPGQIRNSNGPAIAALARRHGGEPVMLGIARDTDDHLRACLAAANGADLIVTTGGVSVGDYDRVKDVLRAEGQIDLWKVRMKPGKPLAFGNIGGIPLLGLPGNPVAAMVAFEQFARPAIRRMLGHTHLRIPTVSARLTGTIGNHGGRRHYVRVAVHTTSDGYVATPVSNQGAGTLTSMIGANGLLTIPENVSLATAGMSFPVQMLDWDLGENTRGTVERGDVPGSPTC